MRNRSVPEDEQYIRIVLIRHGATQGNLEKRYIGKTDEPLSSYGIAELKQNISKGYYPPVRRLYVSPMKRCISTAELIYPDITQIQLEDLKECDFGLFEGKNYIELSGNEQYQRWIDSNAVLPFPEGEDIKDYKKRCVRGWQKLVQQCHNEAFDKAGNEEKVMSAACVVHGGTIMSVISQMYGGDYYDYMCANGGGYICSVAANGCISLVTPVGQ